MSVFETECVVFTSIPNTLPLEPPKPVHVWCVSSSSSYFFLLSSSSPSVTYLVHPPQCAHKIGAAKFTEREETVATGVHFVKDPRRDRARVPKWVYGCVGGRGRRTVDTDMKREVRLGPSLSQTLPDASFSLWPTHQRRIHVI